MQVYHSFTSMLADMAKNGWMREDITNGFTLTPNSDMGTGRITILGDLNKMFCVMEMDILFYKPQFMVNYSTERGVQISFVESIDAEYYKDKDDILTGHFGNFIYINNLCIPWFKKYAINKPTKAITLMLSEDFLQSENINLSTEDWDLFAQAINGRNTSMPTLTAILKQIIQTSISDEFFQLYLKTKTIEAFLLLWDYAKKAENSNLKKLTKKSRIAVEAALELLNENFISPPIITDLAKLLGIDKTTLQFAFKEIVGLSIHKYIRTLKMQKALLLLANGSMTIAEIANSVGYQSKIHFYRAFEDMFSMKPLEMRKILTIKAT